MEYFWCWVLLLGQRFAFFQMSYHFSEQILTLSFCSSNYCLLSVVSTLSFMHFYMCFCVPFPTSSVRATFHFSPPLLLSGQICLISAAVIPVFCSLDRGSLLSMRVAVSWWSDSISTESSCAFISSLGARSSPVWCSWGR